MLDKAACPHSRMNMFRLFGKRLLICIIIGRNNACRANKLEYFILTLPYFQYQISNGWYNHSPSMVICPSLTSMTAFDTTFPSSIARARGVSILSWMYLLIGLAP